MTEQGLLTNVPTKITRQCDPNFGNRPFYNRQFAYMVCYYWCWLRLYPFNIKLSFIIDLLLGFVKGIFLKKMIYQTANDLLKNFHCDLLFKACKNKAFRIWTENRKSKPKINFQKGIDNISSSLYNHKYNKFKKIKSLKRRVASSVFYRESAFGESRGRLS